MKEISWLAILLALCLFASFAIVACGDDDDDDSGGGDVGPCAEDTLGACFYICNDGKVDCAENRSKGYGCNEGCESWAEQQCEENSGTNEAIFDPECPCSSGSGTPAWSEDLTFEDVYRPIDCWPPWYFRVSDLCDDYSDCDLDHLWDENGDCEEYYEYCEFEFWECYWGCAREQFDMQDWNCGCFEDCFNEYCGEGGGSDDDDDDASGVWEDPATEYMWQVDPVNEYEQIPDWVDGFEYCEDLSLGGYTDWHLPTIGEYRTIIRGCPGTETGGNCGVTDQCLNLTQCWNGSCDGCTLDAGPAADGCYWPSQLKGDCDGVYGSSSPVEPGGGVTVHDVSFNSARLGNMDRQFSMYVRCVRNTDGSGDDDDDSGDDDDDDDGSPQIASASWNPDPVEYDSYSNSWISTTTFYVCDYQGDLSGGAVYFLIAGTNESFWQAPYQEWNDYPGGAPYAPDCGNMAEVQFGTIFGFGSTPPGLGTMCVDIEVSDGAGNFSNKLTNICVTVP